MREQKGFIAITELMIIIGIVGILTAVAIPMFRSARTMAQNARAITEMADIFRPGTEQYYLDVREYPKSVNGTFDKATNGYGLITNPYDAGGQPILYARWNGPYIPVNWRGDPWSKVGNQKDYEVKGDGTFLAVISAGKDGAFHTHGDTYASWDGEYVENKGTFNDGCDDVGVIINKP